MDWINIPILSCFSVIWVLSFPHLYWEIEYIPASHDSYEDVQVISNFNRNGKEWLILPGRIKEHFIEEIPFKLNDKENIGV